MSEERRRVSFLPRWSISDIRSTPKDTLYLKRSKPYRKRQPCIMSQNQRFAFVLLQILTKFVTCASSALYVVEVG